MKAEELAEWISFAKVDNYKLGNKEVYVATKYNEQLILICHRVQYVHGLHPHINLIWINNGISKLLYQDIVDEVFGQIKHSTGELEGEYNPRENVETIFCAFVKKCENT